MADVPVTIGAVIAYIGEIWPHLAAFAVNFMTGRAVVLVIEGSSPCYRGILSGDCVQVFQRNAEQREHDCEKHGSYQNSDRSSRWSAFRVTVHKRQQEQAQDEQTRQNPRGQRFQRTGHIFEELVEKEKIPFRHRRERMIRWISPIGQRERHGRRQGHDRQKTPQHYDRIHVYLLRVERFAAVTGTL